MVKNKPSYRRKKWRSKYQIKPMKTINHPRQFALNNSFLNVSKNVRKIGISSSFIVFFLATVYNATVLGKIPKIPTPNKVKKTHNIFKYAKCVIHLHNPYKVESNLPIRSSIPSILTSNLFSTTIG